MILTAYGNKFIEGTVKVAAKTILGKKKKPKNKPWFDEECELWFERRGKARLDSFSNSSNEAEETYRSVERQTRALYRRKNASLK